MTNIIATVNVTRAFELKALSVGLKVGRVEPITAAVLIEDWCFMAANEARISNHIAIARAAAQSIIKAL